MSAINLLTAIPGPKSLEIIERRKNAMPVGLAKSTEIAISSAEGGVVTDVDGNTLLDFAGGIGMMNIGHSNENVVRAMKYQLDKYIHICSLVATPEPYVELAELINKLTPGNFPKKTILANSGSEAVENAINIARYYTKRSAIICFEGGYHGRTLLTLSLTSKYALFKKGFGPFVSDIYRLPAPNVYRKPDQFSEPEYIKHCIKQFEVAMIAQIDPDSVAAIIIEPVQGEGGFIPMPKLFLQKLRDVATQHGIILIFDEIQCGASRTGKLFACEHFNVVPDIICMAKSIGAGMPISATTGKAEIMDSVHLGGVGGTYGGNPVSCVAAIAALKILSSNEFLARVNHVGNLIAMKLEEWKSKYACIGDVRGIGAMRLVEFVKNKTSKEPDVEIAMEIIKDAVSHGVILIRAGLFSNCIRLLPPIVMTDEQLNEGLLVLENAIKDLPKKEIMVDKIFFNGNVFTQDKKNPIATAFAISHGKFIGVGDDESMLQLKTENAQFIDLENNNVFPGFNDAHIHIWKVGNLLTYMLDLRGVESIEELTDKLNDYSKQHPELDWIQARGFNESELKEKRIPTKNDLDKINTTKPICITRTCAHQIVVNSVALEIAGINSETRSPSGGEIKYLINGEPSGHFTETAIGLILNKIPKYDQQQYRKMILSAQDALIDCGITSATDPAVDDNLIEVYKQMDRDKELKVRINLFPIRIPDGGNIINPLPEKYESPYLKIDTVKFFADGGLSGKTAALKRPYKSSSEKGVLRLNKEKFIPLALETQDKGFRIATHAIGDAAIEMVLDVYQQIADKNSSKINHRIEHLGMPSENDLLRMKELNISAIMQPIFIYELGKNFIEYVDDHYLNYLYPARSVLNSGINLALSTDAPVVKNFDPLFNIQTSINRKVVDGNTISENQQLTFQQAMFAYTMGSAIAHGDEKNKGSIETGKYADFIILKNLNNESKTVLSTYINGELVKF